MDAFISTFWVLGCRNRALLHDKIGEKLGFDVVKGVFSRDQIEINTFIT